MTEKKVVILVAGGTGGHLFPAEALAGELDKRGYDAHLATDERAKRFVRYFAEDHVHVIPSATITSRNPFAVARTLWQLLRGVRTSRRVFRKLRPVLVGGFGGYPTLPPLYAAKSEGLLTFVHEQNAVMGRANRAMAGRVDAIAGGFLKEEGPFKNKIVITGNPVRKAVIEAARQPYHPSSGNDAFNLLVFGGSQGASFFTEILPEAVKHLGEPAQKRLRIVEQVRGDGKALDDIYHGLHIDAVVKEFFDDMPERIANAQYIIARAGASTVSEIAAIGRPALLVPYPYALDHDQSANAGKLAATGAVKVIQQNELDAKKLAKVIETVMDNSELLETQAKAAKSAGHTDAAEKLADMCEALIAGKTAKEFKEGETS
ncbi:undecaprenyldiphospho-muramoylpentapeptide beta-N-acetylglucosaminyltransferase [uncultured Bartonella sp.]|uniref:undecaprenyldiphospho-muramoylpentapeptide beta-N-acetylglucosaminyltransferase n=1 Tax=uncultured Bartonella sp. TaxID=104108 RepID=UPI002616711E|nr:undecaprenyldiphospho-muramoylpentapeptide beta-N-acetylglucosaminyltransferase [uncultured Bartonella sp.]